MFRRPADARGGGGGCSSHGRVGVIHRNGRRQLAPAKAPVGRRLVVGVRFAGCLARVVAAATCNGDEAYCALPVGSYTWPGTHNSGSSTQVNNQGTAPMQECFYDNHERNYVEQLDYGIRMLQADVCNTGTSEAPVLVNCHRGDGGFGDALGQSMITSITRIRQWLVDNPREVVFLLHGNGRSYVDALREVIEDVFGALRTPSSGAADSAGGPFGVLWHGVDSNEADKFDVGKLTLGSLIDDGMRFIYATGGVMVDSYDSSKQTSASLLQDYIEDISQGTVGGLQGTDASPASALFSMFPYRTDLTCNKVLTKAMNEAIFPPDSAAATLPAPASTDCGGCMCAGYRSRVEVAQQQLRARGYHLGAIIADWTQYGALLQTVQRLNQANLRHLSGAKEPCVFSPTVEASTQVAPSTAAASTQVAPTTAAPSTAAEGRQDNGQASRAPVTRAATAGILGSLLSLLPLLARGPRQRS